MKYYIRVVTISVLLQKVSPNPSLFVFTDCYSQTNLFDMIEYITLYDTTVKVSILQRYPFSSQIFLFWSFVMLGYYVCV